MCMPKNLINSIFCVFFLPFLTYSQVKDSLNHTTLKEVVISSSRIREELLVSPISIQKIDRRTLLSSPQSSFFDALEHVSGIQMITPSLGFKVLNARGFNNTTNVRFSQLVDGMDVQSPHIGGPIGNALGPSDLDIANVEIVSGIASTLYGMNTVNGLANFSTLNPFTSQGITFQQKLGINHINDSNTSAKAFNESALRYAKAVNDKFAYKINLTYTAGFDWIANNQNDLNPLANTSTGLLGIDNPGRDLVNVYGNESSNRKTISLLGKSYVVSRTGYDEKDVVDYTLSNLKGDIGIYYKLNSNVQITYKYHFANLNNVYQRSNRFRLQDYFLDQHAFQIQSNKASFKVYSNSENTGNSYNLRSMAENIDRSFKSDAVWYADFTKAVNSSVASGLTVAQAMNSARTAADLGRFMPGTQAYKDQLAKLQQVNNWDIGAALKVQSRLVHAEGQLNVDQLLPALQNAGLGVQVGADLRTFIIGSDGNYFVNPEKGNESGPIVYSKYGVFFSIQKSLFQQKLKIGFVQRMDNNDYFQATYNPRLTAVFVPNEYHCVRLGVQTGYRFPSIFEAYSNINSGGVKRVGGLPIMSTGVFENSYLTASINSFQAAVLNDVNKNGLSKAQSIQKNKDLLVKNTYTYIKPEYVQSYEIGYRGAILDNKLVINADFYMNRYANFIAQTNVNVPKTANQDSIAIVLNDKNLQTPYRVWTNSKSLVKTYGGTFGFNYRISKWIFNANVSYSKLDQSENQDGLEDGYNTPDWVFNVGVSSMKLAKNWGAGINYRWQNSYYWQSFLANDWVPAYGTLDAQVQYRFTSIPVSAKLSGTNLLNQKYFSFVGGPQIGGMYMITLLVN